MSFQEKKEFGEILRHKLEELGPAFIKFGQMLSVRFDLLPAEICEELQGLLGSDKPFDNEIARQRIESELGIPIDQLFSEFSDEPVAAASIGQVYKARLRTGELVAVKVRRPKIISRMKRDIAVLKRLVRIAERYTSLKQLRLSKIVEEFECWSLKEVDYMVELGNIEQFMFKYKNVEGLRVPKPYRRYTTSRVLVMEFIEGVTVEEVMKAVEGREESVVVRGRRFYVKTLILEIFRILVAQLLEGGIFHADPHPANVIIDNDGVICLIDFGIVGKLSRKMVMNIREMIKAVSSGNVEKIVDVAMSIDERPGNEKTESFKSEISEYILSYAGSSIGDEGFTQFMVRLLRIGSMNGFEWPMDLVLFAKQFVTLDGIALKLYPEIDPLEQASVYVQKFAVKDFVDKFSDSNLTKAFYKYSDIATKFPDIALKLIESAEKIVDRINSGEKDILGLGASKEKESGEGGVVSILSAGFIAIFLLAAALIFTLIDIGDQLILRFIWITVIILSSVLSILILTKH